jgi:diguanylate cyclase (GGDEF)-like protein
MRQALITGFLAAGTLAALLGLLLGRRMSAALDELAEAIRTMPASGELPQPVPQRSNDEIGDLAAAFNRMGADLMQSHAELRELSVRDPLTQLYNRRHFDAQAAQLFEQAVRYDHPLTVMVGDLDHFKQINDGFSHAVGDEVLRRVARLLQQHTRKSDLLARYGGEEFVIAFAETGMEQAAQQCETLRRLIENQPWQEIQAGLRVTISMGLNADLSLGSVDRMLSAADTQLYAAKHAGRNRVEPRPAVG